MKVTLRQIIESLPAINELAIKPIKIGQSYKISKILNEINGHLKPYQDVRNKLIENYKADTSGSVLVFSEDEEENAQLRLAFDKELDPVLDEMIIFQNVSKISVTKLDNVQIAPGFLAALDWLLED